MTETQVEIDWDSAPGVPIIMIHGVGDSVVSWGEVVKHLGKERPLVRYTLRGHRTDGKNVAPPYLIDDFVQDVIDLADTQGMSEFILAGFSLGGLIAQATVLRHPDRVRAVVAVGSIADRTKSEQKRVLERFNEVQEKGPLAVAQVSVDRWYSPEYLRQHPEAREQTLVRMSLLDPDCYAAAYYVLATNDFAEHLAEIAVPVLAIAGEGDVGSPPRMSQYIADHVQRGTAVIIPNVKHSLLQEVPETIAKELNNFVITHRL